VPNDLTAGSVRLSDLRRSQAGDASLENLLNTLTGKMQACARLAVFAYEAGNEGHPTLATAFRELADTERQSFNTLLACLHRHLDEMPTPVTQRSDVPEAGCP
jgi:rubrerythrin